MRPMPSTNMVKARVLAVVFAKKYKIDLKELLMVLGRLRPNLGEKVNYIVEPKDWSIKADGVNIAREINVLKGHPKISITRRPYLASAPLVHFGSQFMFQNWCNYMSKNQKIIVTYFHGKLGEDRITDANLEFLIANQRKISAVIVSFELMRQRLISLGIPSSLIKLIPIGVSSSNYVPPESLNQVLKTRESLGIPVGCKIIGSFQKDGEGWGDGLSPKLIKGPDLFVESIRLISKKIPIFVLLSGPARGYVIKKLSEYGIPHAHRYVRDPEELIRHYQALDLYIVSSREEGGPKGLIEALSVGCPVVSTPVGLATDMKSKSALLSILKSFEIEEIASESVRILNSSLEFPDRELLRDHILKYDWKEIARRHTEEVYLPLILETR